MNLELLIGPIVGGVIGYITNGIAIKMLFRPLKSIYIVGVKLPFTPGIIPKEKGRLARSIGEVVGKELINENVLEKVLLKDNIYAQIDQKVDNIIEQYRTSELTVEELCEQAIESDTLQQIKGKIQEGLSEKLYTQVVQLNIGQLAVENLVSEIKEGSLKPLLGPLAFFINDSFIEGIAVKLEPIINQMVEDKGKELIEDAVEKEGKTFSKKPVSEVAQKVKENISIIKELVKKSYTYFVQHNLAHSLEVVNLSKVVEERINAFDTLELEKMILKIMKKELNAIIWLGALLGAILGCIISIV